MIKTTVDIYGMSCGMCEAHINDLIRKEFNVKSVKSSHKNNNSIIISNDPLSEEEIRQKINATGYEVNGIKSEEYEKRGLFSKKNK